MRASQSRQDGRGRRLRFAVGSVTSKPSGCSLSLSFHRCARSLDALPSSSLNERLSLVKMHAFDSSGAGQSLANHTISRKSGTFRLHLKEWCRFRMKESRAASPAHCWPRSVLHRTRPSSGLSLESQVVSQTGRRVPSCSLRTCQACAPKESAHGALLFSKNTFHLCRLLAHNRVYVEESLHLKELGYNYQRLLKDAISAADLGIFAGGKERRVKKALHECRLETPEQTPARVQETPRTMFQSNERTQHRISPVYLGKSQANFQTQPEEPSRRQHGGCGVGNLGEGSLAQTRQSADFVGEVDGLGGLQTRDVDQRGEAPCICCIRRDRCTIGRFCEQENEELSGQKSGCMELGRRGKSAFTSLGSDALDAGLVRRLSADESTVTM
jgi:hypothetical protein